MGVVATAPGRVNLIGDHTDTSGGWCLPMAVDLATVIEGDFGGDVVELRSEREPVAAVVPIGVDSVAAASTEPAWARYVAGVVAEVGPGRGFTGEVRTSIPVGAGLSSSAALEVALALALGFEGPPLELARLCQRAEQRATGVPCGIMDQLTSVSGQTGRALLIDCTTLDVTSVAIPGDVEVFAIHSGEQRRLAGSGYAARRAEVEAAHDVVGPLRTASADQLGALRDTTLRRRARHVITENARVHQVAAALGAGDAEQAGRLMLESHHSLRDDFEVSTPALDQLVEELVRRPGVLGARLTGAGFGGCAVALARPGVLRPGPGSWLLKPSAGARVVTSIH